MTNEELAALLIEAGQHHHHAYIIADGADPEWALWYAGYLQTKIWDRAGTVPSRSSLIHLLIEAEKRFIADDQATEWPPYYANFILKNLAEG